MPPVGRIETSLAVGRGEGVPRPPRIPAAQIAVEVGPEYATNAVERHGVDAGIQETAKGSTFAISVMKNVEGLWSHKNINSFCRLEVKLKCKFRLILK